MVNQIQGKAAPINKAAVLAKLLEQGSKSLDSLVCKTGWGQEVTQHALLLLVVAGRVKCVRGSGRLMYALRSSSLNKVEQIC